MLGYVEVFVIEALTLPNDLKPESEHPMRALKPESEHHPNPEANSKPEDI